MAARIGILILGLLVIVSALGVVLSRHESRKLFVELQELQGQRDEMNIEWGRLQIEQSTWATHSRVAGEAATQLGMVVPKTEHVRIIKTR